jgi:hypothetical protein
MTFSKYVCWQPEMVRKVMDVEATQPEDHIFLATHHPIKMYRQDLTEAQSRIPYDENSFLNDFLGTPDFSFVPVLGTSGTGKSHLIRWLYTRLKSICIEPHYRVLLIPKVGTNLKDIIERILTGIEGSEFEEYRSRLRQAANTLTVAEACEQLLANLAIAVGLSGKQDITSLSDLEYEIAKNLPDLLRDPFFAEEFWLKSGGIIDRLVIHILGDRVGVEDVEERRGFSIEDLPTGILNRQKASEKAREFYTHLDGNFIPKDEVVKWLNKHLDIAIAKVLNLGREDLQRLMLDVRRALARQGVELILLIEDFAKLQGIDREVLESVLARPQQGEGEPLCAMRTALACTTGYFEGLLDTVRTRTDFSVNLDIETVNDQSLVTQTDVQQLVARYLNAVRLDNKEIQAWLTESNEETGKPDHSVPNACMDCEYRLSCHAGFGEIDGIGLYPFNSTAIEIMHGRVKTKIFNPRTLIKDVLRYTLEYHRADLEEGRFPSDLLLEHFKKDRLEMMIGLEIDNKDNPDDASRRKALLNLWTNGNELCDLPSEVHTAFDLRPLGIQIQKVATVTTATTATRAKTPTTTFTVNRPTATSTSPVSEEQEAISLPIKLAEQLQALDQWQKGNQLAQDVARDLSISIFPSIISRINWDAELLLKSVIEGLFLGARNINFENAATSTNPRGIELRLPLEDNDLRYTAIALQAMLLYKHYKNWGFSYQNTHGSTYFRIYARKLEEWSNFVLQEIPKYTTQSRTTWNPVPAVTELLAVAGRMAGRPTDSLEDLVEVIFADLEKIEVVGRAENWQKLFNAFKKAQPELLKILQARIPCTKGGHTKLQVIDASQLVEPLKSIAKNWKPQIDVSDVSEDKPFKEIRHARKAVDQLLEQAIRDERDRHLEIYNQVINAFGEDFLGSNENKDQIVEVLSQAIQKAKEAGVATGKLTELESVTEEFKKTRIETYIKNLKEINEIDDTGVLFQKLSQLSQKPMDAIANFISVAKQCLTSSVQRAESSLDGLKEAGGGDLSSCYAQIEKSLIEMKNTASEIKEKPLC